MTARTLMIQGTASSVGKSVLVTALCRVFADRGLRVAPFKAQNMSNNSYATADGLEIGRAQAEQARAARVEPDVRMNPVLLKPEGEMTSQVVLIGKAAGSLRAGYIHRKRHLWTQVRRALDSLREDHDLVVIEGAGSPAEINLKRGDIVNMRVARHAQSPVILVGDIDNGGVFAHLVGTLALLTPTERRLVRGLIINKFRGDYGLLEPGIPMLERRARRPVLGVMRYLHDLTIAEEDAVALDRPGRARTQGTRIAVVRLPHISNFDDFDPLAAEPGVSLNYVTSPAGLEGTEMIILPGTKNTRADLRWLRDRGLDASILAARRRGAAVVGVCGGFQMLGREVCDPLGAEGAAGTETGLGLLDVRTTFSREKTTRRATGAVAASRGLLARLQGVRVNGYEIHMGGTLASTDAGVSRPPGPPFVLGPEGRGNGSISADGRVFGTYLHGLFANDAFRRGLLANLGRKDGAVTTWDPEVHIARLAREAERYLDIDRIAGIAGV